MNYSKHYELSSYTYKEIDFIYDAFVFFNAISCGLLMGFYFVAIFVYKPMHDKCIHEIFDCQYPPLPFSDMYQLKEYETSTQYTPNVNSFVMENTSHGNIVMKYDYDNEGFIYWGNKAVAYPELNTVARKYVNMFLCKHLYHDYKKPVDDKQDDKQDDNDVFFRSAASKKMTKLKDNNEDVKRNKFTHRGNFSDFKFLQPYMTKDKEDKQKMSFDVFKLLFYKKDT